MLTIMVALLGFLRKQKPRSLDRGVRLKLVSFRWPLVAHPRSQLLRSRCFWEPEVSGKCGAWNKSCHKNCFRDAKSVESEANNGLVGYWMELAACENTLLEFDPIRRTVPTTNTRITANITAYSAMSCPASSVQRRFINSRICSPPAPRQF